MTRSTELTGFAILCAWAFWTAVHPCGFEPQTFGSVERDFAAATYGNLPKHGGKHRFATTDAFAARSPIFPSRQRARAYLGLDAHHVVCIRSRPPMVSPKSIRQLKDELECLYTPPLRAAATWYPIRQVLEEFDQVGIKLTSELQPPAIGRWIKAHPDRGAMTVKKLLGSLRAACSYAVQMRYLERSPFEFRREWVRAPKTLAPKHHSAEAISSVLKHLESERLLGWEEHRLYALTALYAYTGLRKMEALNSKVADYHLDDGFFDLVAHRRLKTSDSEQPIPLPSRLVAILRDWLPKTGSDWAFPNKGRMGPWTGGSPGRKPLDRIKIAGERAGVKGFTVLSLRHSWATHAESLWDLGEGVTKRVLRHTTTRTQLHYRHADLPNLRRRVEGISFGGEGASRGQVQTLGA